MKSARGCNMRKKGLFVSIQKGGFQGFFGVVCILFLCVVSQIKGFWSELNCVFRGRSKREFTGFLGGVYSETRY